MPNKYCIHNRVDEAISSGRDFFLKLTNNISEKNKQLIAQLNQQTCYTIKSFREPLRTSCNDISVWLSQKSIKNSYIFNNALDQDKGFIFAKDRENLENQLNEMRKIILINKNNGLDSENKVFLLQIDRLLEVLKEISVNKYSIIHCMANSLFLFFTKKKNDLNKRDLIAKILLIIIENNNLAKEQINLIKKFNTYLYTRATSKLDNFINELNNLQLLKKVYSLVDIEEMKKIANLLKKTKGLKKIKTRTIDFDSDGIGFCVEDKEKQDALIFLAEIKRLANINLEEINLIFDDKVDHEELILLEEFKRLGEINLEEVQCIEKNNLEETRLQRRIKKKLEKKLFREIKGTNKVNRKTLLSAIQEEIEVFSGKKFIKGFPAYMSIPFELPSFEEKNNSLLNDFLRFIKFEDFKKLMDEAKKTFLSITEIMSILKTIDRFFNQLGSEKAYSKPFEEKTSIFKRHFSKENIVIFLEDSLKLFMAHTLYPEKNIRIHPIELNNQFKEIKFNNELELAGFIESNNLENIIKKQKSMISDYLDKNLHKDILFNDEITENKVYRDSSVFKYFFEKIKKFIVNFLRNYFVSRENKLAFLSQLKENLGFNVSFDSISNFIVKLKWWHLIFYGINPFFFYKKGSKKELSKQLFLALIDKDFNELIHCLDKATDHAKRIKYTDELSAIINRLKSLDQNDSDNIGKKSKSRCDIIKELEYIIKELLEKSSTLEKQADLCLSRFSELLNLSKTEVETLERVKKAKNNVPTGSENNSYFINWLQRQQKQDREADTNSKTSFPRQRAL